MMGLGSSCGLLELRGSLRDFVGGESRTMVSLASF